jgi:hypothetical protein
MTIPDLINAAFEFSGGYFVFRHCLAVKRDKAVKGVSIISTVFFALWGWWNIYYYPSLEQWASFYGGIAISAANMYWIYLLMKYRTKETVVSVL